MEEDGMYKATLQVVSLVNVYYKAESQKDAERIYMEYRNDIESAIEDEKNVYVYDIRPNGAAYTFIEPCDYDDAYDDGSSIIFQVDE
jgi:hypothetical protein